MDAPIEIVELQPRRALTVRRKMPQSGLGAFFMELFPRLRTAIVARSEERRVGKECTEQCRSRWSPYH